MKLAGADSSDKQTRSTTAHYGFYYAYISYILIQVDKQIFSRKLVGIY